MKTATAIVCNIAMRQHPGASLLLVLTLLAGRAASADDWPHWRGGQRSGVLTESSVYEAGAWPPGNVAWETNVGRGSTSPVVVAGRVYVLGWEEGRDTLRALDLADGRELWRQSYEAPEYGRHAMGDQGMYAAVTSSPEYDPQTRFLYTLSVDGQLQCWNLAAKGAKVWGINLYDLYRAEPRAKIGRSGRRDYGYTTSPLVQGETLVVEVGAPEGNLMGFDKRTGRRRWVSQSKDQAGHSGGPVPMEVDGLPALAVLTLDHLLVARLDAGHEGQTLAEYPWQTEFANNVATPAVDGQHVLITAGYNHRATCKLAISRRGAEKVWEVPQYSLVCSPVIHAGHVYFVWGRPYCLDLATGELEWEGPRAFGDAGSCAVTADGRVLFFGGQGRLALAEGAERSPREYRELASLEPVFRTDAWPHLVLADGRLLLKDWHGNMQCRRLVRRQD